MLIRWKRNLLLPLLFLGAAMFMVQCTASGTPSQRANGLVCQSYSTTSVGGMGVTKGADCRFKCPDGRLLSLPDAIASQTRDQLNFLFCGVPLPASNGIASANGGQPFVPTPTFAVPLSRYVDSCDLDKHVINFILAQPAASLTGKTIEVDIRNQPLPCSLLPWPPGVYSCKLPPHTSFPAGIEVRLNGQVVDLWAYSGGSCYYGQTPRVPQPASPTQAPPQSGPPPGPGPKPPKPPHPPHPPHGHGGH